VQVIASKDSSPKCVEWDVKLYSLTHSLNDTFFVSLCTCVVITVDCDCDIEEHFKRSLGRDYCNYLNQPSADSAVRHSAAPWNGAVTFSSAAAAPCSSATTSSGVTSHTTLSDLLSADAKIHDNGSDVNKKCSAISVTGITSAEVSQVSLSAVPILEISDQIE